MDCEINDKATSHHHNIDITGYKNLERKLETTLKELKDITNALHQMAEVTITDTDGTITYANDKFCELTKYTREELIGQNHRIIKSGSHSEEVYKELWDTITQGKVWHNEIKNKAKDGTFYWADSTIVPFLNDDGVPYQYVAIRKDITEKKEYEETIKKLAFEDSLTHLPNAKSLQLHIGKLCENTSEKFAVLFFDIDHFKYINDHYSFATGDQILIEVANVLFIFSKEHGGFVSHLSADKYIILININHILEASQIADNLLQMINRPFVIHNQPLYITASIGISYFPEDGTDGSSLIEKADIALNNGKKLGKNQYHQYTKIMDVESFKKFTLQNDIRKALKNEEFFLEYQPKLDTNTRQIIAAEALVRWDHPKWGTVPPNEFIDIAEESGLIIQLGEWILQKVCIQINEWKKKRLREIPIAVNFSPTQFSDEKITDMVLRILHETDVNPKCLEIEITEQGILYDYEMITQKMKILRNVGISFAIDDFGTGYSSLKTLNQLKFDSVKIDRSFIKDICRNEGSLQITKAIIQLAHNLNIKVVAEGVEDFHQFSILKEQNCDYIQGYLFSRPVAPLEFEKLMIDNPPVSEKLRLISKQSNENRRKYFRILFKYPLIGSMTVHLFNNKPVQIGNSPILIEDIGPGGLCYVTKIKFPINEGFVLGVETKILDTQLAFQGHNVWCKEVDDGLYQYGFEFNIEETDRTHLLRLLNQFQIKYKKDVFLPSCSFIKISNNAQFFNQN